ncbi:MAG: 30S ribosomal protein S13 [Endomicrobium sp.]|jgi:small subunit ribosomal protein S13|nr:30S ribosomal protein S13 [Endomicrobium sp.]
MARIAGVDLPKHKIINIALRYIYGIGPKRANEIVTQLSLRSTTKVKDLTDEEVNRINDYITKNLQVEGDLKRDIQINIKRLITTGSYRGLRHRRSLPVRGQRSKTNARTRRGKRKTIGAGKSSLKTFNKNKKN